MRRILRENGLTIVMFTLFIFALAGQSVTGYRQYNEGQKDHGQPTINFSEYFSTGHFVEAVFENWESEFLQMGMYVLLTAYLYQKGSPESKKLNEKEAVDTPPSKSKRKRKDAPWPVQRGGFILKLYQNSLCLALLLLFLLSFALHAAGGAKEYSQDQMQHGGQAVSMIQYLGTSRFWFESFQNWQSEFLSVGVLVVLSIFLRQKGSPESKPVDAPHSKTGGD
ncbi:MAG: hypothetical protein QOH63_4069 [Acidobacteriota bacterium]|jgi:hypothetical protein|nr:hypothetical protein [Acidobacteriota bacterium]